MRRIGSALGLLLGNRVLPGMRTIAVARGRGGGGMSRSVSAIAMAGGCDGRGADLRTAGRGCG